jgi:hypothetical protein
VAGGTVFELNLNAYFAAHSRTLKKTILESPGKFDQIAAELTSGRCRVYTADVSELGAIRYKTGKPEQFDILSEQISKEPLAPLVRADASARLQCFLQVVPRIRVLWIDRERSLEVLDGLFRSPEAHEGDPEVVVRFRSLRVH